MLTFFTTAKPFVDHAGVIQRNALHSWRRLRHDVEIIVFGDERGTAEVCAELGLRHEPHVERHESGMKYLNYIFARAQEMARHEYLCYSNCDIILLSDFEEAFRRLGKWRDRFLLISQRWDTNVLEALDFGNASWQENLRRYAKESGKLQTPHFIDYFVFPKGLYHNIPPLLIGRSFWDWWLVWKALKSVPVVDCTSFVTAVHQNHDHDYHPQGKQGTNEDTLAMRNFKLAGNGRDLRMLEHATYKMDPKGVVRWTPLRGLKFRGRQMLWKILVLKTFSLRRRLGFRRESLRKLLRRRNAVNS